MLWEAYQYFTTPASNLAKKMGYLEEAIAMSARYKRCYDDWQPHFEACQKVILQAVAQCNGFKTIAILGAGAMQDIPLKQLAQQFEEVLLVDMVFLKPARKWAKQFDNVVLIEQDVTFSLETSFWGDKTVKNNQAWWSDRQLDCVVSLNLLTQLPLIPVRWLMSKYQMTEAEADVYAKQMLQNHLALLERLAPVRCLIADRLVVETDAEGKQVDQFDPAWEVPLPEPVQTWQWQVIPLGEVSKTLCQTHQVGANIW